MYLSSGNDPTHCAINKCKLLHYPVTQKAQTQQIRLQNGYLSTKNEHRFRLNGWVWKGNRFNLKHEAPLFVSLSTTQFALTNWFSLNKHDSKDSRLVAAKKHPNLSISYMSRIQTRTRFTNAKICVRSFMIFLLFWYATDMRIRWGQVNNMIGTCWEVKRQFKTWDGFKMAMDILFLEHIHLLAMQKIDVSKYPYPSVLVRLERSGKFLSSVL